MELLLSPQLPGHVDFVEPLPQRRPEFSSCKPQRSGEPCKTCENPLPTSCEELLELFEAQKCRKSVTKARRQRIEQLKAVQAHELESSQFDTASLQLDDTSAHIATQESPRFDARDISIVPSMNEILEQSVHRDSTPKSGPTTMDRTALFYSEDFRGQDWSLSTLPLQSDNEAASQESVTSQNLDDRVVPSLHVSEEVIWHGRELRPRSAPSNNADRKDSTPLQDGRSIQSIATQRRMSTAERKKSPRSPSLRLINRKQVSTAIRHKRDRFISHHRSKFVPLLPGDNYVEGLSDRVSSTVPLYQDVKQPEGINAILKPYQLKGLSFLVHMHQNGMPAILGDEMGLGKTLQTLSLFQFLKLQEGSSGSTPMENRPFLVICPLAVLENWVSEARKFTPDLRVLRFHGTIEERELLKDQFRKTVSKSSQGRKILKYNKSSKQDLQNRPFDIVVTTYDAFKAEVSWFRSVFAWRYVVLDEGHCIKNYKSNIAHLLQTFHADYRMILTGTPLQNNLVELWSLLHWLLPDIFVPKTLPFFEKAFNLTKGLVNQPVLHDARRLLELLMLRRMKNSPGVDLNLPPKNVIRLFVPLTSTQKRWYLKLLTQQSDDMLEDIYRGAHDKEQHLSTTNGVNADQDSWRRLLNLVMQLRKVCTHPYLMPGAAPAINSIGPELYQQSGKFTALYKLVQELVIRQGKKIIIFSNFTEVLDWVQDLMAYVSENGARFECLRFDGSTVRAKRNLYIRLFQDHESNYKVFLISTRAGGVGLTLTAATEAIFLEEDWNPQIDLQAEARCHRIGQTKPVTIYKICTAGTVEEQMLGRIHKKLYLSAKITEALQNVHDTSALHADQPTVAESKSLFGSYSEFKSLLRKGTQALAGGEIDAEELLNWSFTSMLNKCQQKDELINDEATDETAWLKTMEKVECAVFDGQRYARERGEYIDHSIIPTTSREDRHKGKEMTVEIDGFSVSKASLQCAEWEATPTLAGKDPSLRDVKRMKQAIQHQEHCQMCNQEYGTMYICSNCPRSYHAQCMDNYDADRAKDMTNWNCSQHACVMCKKKASEAGGMIFRCRWCIAGYCEDCLDWNACSPIGDNLDEYRVLGFPEKREAYYIVCPDCNVPEFREAQNAQAQFYKELATRVAAYEAAHIEIPSMPSTPAIVDSIETDLVSRPRFSTPPRPASSPIFSETPGLTSRAQSTIEPWSPVTPVTPTPKMANLVLGTPTPMTAKRKAPEEEWGRVQNSRKKKQQKVYYELEI